MKKICLIVSTPMTVKAFLLKHIEYLSKSYDVTVVANTDINLQKEYGVKCKTKSLVITRGINPLKDIVSIYKLYCFFKKESFDLSLSITPKAGLVSSIASYMADIEIRLHFFTGQVWATQKGFFRFLLKSIDKLIARLNTNCLVDSFSQKKFLVHENVLPIKKAATLLSGSISGVDVDKFIYNPEMKKKLQEEYFINDSDIIFMFIGRLNKDKGILDLSEAFKKILSKYNNVKLFIIGPDEQNILSDLQDFTSNKNVVILDYISNPQEILNIADILVLPSYREGFGTIVLEAAAMGIPSIVSNIYGLTDAVVDGKTGLLHEKGNVDDMFKKYEYAINNLYFMQELGINARKRVYKEFRDSQLATELKNYIDGLLH